MKKGAGKKTGWSFKKAVAMLERLSSVKKTG
jgi:molybdenum-dependent DNA-binding transcriptional regulator ModE